MDKNKTRKEGFFDGVLTIDEFRTSSLVLSLLIVLITITIYYLINGDVSSNMLMLAQTLIYSIAGINVAGSISSVVTNKKKVEKDKTQRRIKEG